MDARHQFVRPTTAPFYIADFVSVSLFFQTLVSKPAVGVNHRTLDDGLLNEGKQACRRDIGNSPQPNTSDPIAVLFSRYGHNGFLLGLSPAEALLEATHVGLVNLDPAFETIPPRGEPWRDEACEATTRRSRSCPTPGLAAVRGHSHPSSGW